ncbi:MAG: nucleotidyltransferase domain-containing protein [Deltaproteobacteria bacterium]|nr:nucleotidyltransferase domain-containing protein [Deltaproteobacteria bacterium]
MEGFRDKIIEAVKLLVNACQPDKVILFGSYATGTEKEDSDIDLLVVKEGITNRAEEIVRLSRVLSPLRLPIDLIIVDSETFSYWSDTPGNVYHEAYSAGKTLYEAA